MTFRLMSVAVNCHHIHIIAMNKYDIRKIIVSLFMMFTNNATHACLVITSSCLIFSHVLTLNFNCMYTFIIHLNTEYDCL